MEYFNDLKGKTIIITGGTKGIGKGCAQVFCEAQANVVICARGEKDGIALANELNEKKKESAFSINVMFIILNRLKAWWSLL